MPGARARRLSTPPTLQPTSLTYNTQPAGTHAAMAPLQPSLQNAHASHTDSTSSGIYLHSVRGNTWLKKGNGMAGPVLVGMPTRCPVDSTTSIGEFTADVDIFFRNNLGGDDLVEDLFRDWSYLGVESQSFHNVVEGEWDSNGLESAAYRRAIGRLISKAFFANKDSDFHDMASMLYANLNKLTLDELKEDFEHWFQLARALEPHSACVVAWFRKYEPTLVSLYSATAPVCDPAKGHTTTELPLGSLMEVILIWRTMENQTATALMGLEDKFNILLEYGSGAFLNYGWLAKLAELVTQLRRAPPAVFRMLAHLPYIMAR